MSTDHTPTLEEGLRSNLVAARTGVEAAEEALTAARANLRATIRKANAGTPPALTQAEIGEILGLSKQRISEIANA